MNKRTLGLFALACFFLSSFAFADSQGYFSKQHPLTTKPSTAKTKNYLVAPTDIIINNATFNTMYVTVPAGNFTDAIFSRGYDHIMNYNGAFYTRLVLQDPNFRVFFDATFCPHASITVYGYSPSDVVVDNKSC